MRSTAAGIWYLWQASDGVPGKDRNPVFGATGNPGGTGGKGRNATVTMLDGAVGVSVGVVAAPGAGVFAQSEGGDGGCGGKVLAGAGTATGGGGGSGGDGSSALGISGGFSLAIGGTGGGGSGGAASYTDDGTGDYTVATEGNRARGVHVQSVGGGGGDGGNAISASADPVISVGIGASGSGGAGGDGGAVSATVAGDVTTRGQLANAVQAVSSGGGGGTAGTTVSASEGGLVSVAVAVGGSGGGGGSGGTAAVDASGAIATSGAVSHGILSSSVGGGGGHSGVTVSATGASAMGAVSTSVGGSGGERGAAAAVSASSTGSIDTEGDLSYGIMASSVGGGGGGADAKSLAGGGGSAKGSVTTTGLSMGAAGVTVGGSGGVGGAAGDVSVTSANALSTAGHHAYGILAQSQGGAGGEGGWSAEGGLTGGEFSGEVSVTIGGGGGDGGLAGGVTVNTQSSITTSDLGSHGIMAQSIGGDGGSGGNVYTGNLSVSSEGSAQVNVGIGGSGGNGGKGGVVEVENGASVETDGFLASGILAQSIGGNGGVGGNVYTVVGTVSGGSTFKVGVDVGGDGGTGNDADAVTVDNSGSILTKKGGSAGIQAVSVGGGGGVAGNAANINLNLAGKGEGDSVNLGVDVDVGGSGGAGGHGAAVAVTNSGTVSTAGLYANGIIGHSVGGGGGDGGTASGYTLNMNAACLAPGAAGGSFLCAGKSDESPTKVSASLTVAIGGGGGAAGDGGGVSLENRGTVSTAGFLSHALVAQSHGGGGGNGGVGDLGLAGWTTISTLNAAAKAGGFLIGLASGNKLGFLNQSVVIGGSGGASGSGGDIAVANSGFLNTTGDFSFGIHAQSVGGGGGNGAAGQNSFFGVATVGGSGSGGGDGGAVTVSGDGVISTSGIASVGIFAQSVGGGGGTAGDVGKAFSSAIGGLKYNDLNIGVGVGVQLDAGKGGDGAVSVTAGGVTTTGPLSHGIFAQSVGGSGGVAGISGAFADTFKNFACSNGDVGDAGPVSVTLNGPMSIFGDQAHGIFAQSASGSGDADTSGAVTIAVNDDLTVKGAAGHAILAQSEGSLRVNNGTIGITVAEAAIVSSAPGSAETIALRDGKDNMITNNGSLMHLGGPDATVIATDGSAGLTVLNNGFLEGSVAALGTDLTNADGASFALGTTVGLGSDGTFLNNGRVSPGGLGPIATSTISAGSFEQSATGVIHVDVTYPAASDLIVLSGDEPGAEAKLAGMVQPSPIAGLPEGGNSGLPKSGTSGEFAILTTERRPIDAAALTVANTSTVDYDLSQGTLDENPALFLDFKVDYSPWNGSDVTLAKVPGAVREAVDSNHTGFARHIDELIDLREQDRAATGDQYAFIDDLVLQFLRMEDPAELLDTYERYVAGEVFASSNAALFSSTRFADQLNSCPSLSKEGVAVFRAEGECAWARIGSATTERQSGSHETGYDEDAFGISGGFQAEIAPNWFGGFALGYERSDLDNDRFASEADRFQAGAVIKRTFGTTTAAVSVSGGFSDISGSREVVVPSGMAIAESDPDLWWIAGHTRLSHDVTLGGGFSLTPMVDLGIEHQRQDGYTETGAGAFGLEVGDIKQTFFTVNPTVEVTGSATPLGVDGAFSARAGLLAIAGDTERTTELRLAGVGGAGPSFTVRDDVDPLYGSLGASVNARLSERTTLEASIDALLGDDQQTYSGGLRLNIAF